MHFHIDGLIMAVLVGAAFCFVFFQLFTRRGREWALGGRIAHIFGTPIVQRRGIAKTTINVHSLAPKHVGDGPRVGIEIATTALLSASTLPLTLSQEEARTLSEALREASEYHDAVS